MPYALKEVEKTRMNDRELARLKEEIDVLLFLRGGPHILRLIDVFHETNTTLMILEETKGGNLLHRIVAREDYSEREARQICKALFHAVSFCHKKRIAHRDIKLDNLLLQENGSETSLKLTGFYSSKKVGNVPLTTMCGTPTYVAPEVFMALHGGYDFRCDMWSVGVVVYVLMVGYFPFEGADAVAIAQKVCQKTVHFHPEYWKQASDSVQTLTRGLLERNVQTRLSADDALKSRWIQMEDDGVLATAELSGTKSKLGEICSIAGTHSSGLSGTNDFKPEEGFDSIVVDDDSQSLDIRDVHTDDTDIDHSGFVNVDELYGEEATVKKIVRRDLAPEKLIALNDEIEVLRTIATCDDAAVAETMIQLRSVHEDINATYLVVRERDRTERITITDFALSKRIVFKNTLHTLCGTLEFVAPEMLQNVLAYDVECDMWAVGVILYMMLSGHHPFDVGSEHNRGNPQEELLKRIRHPMHTIYEDSGPSIRVDYGSDVVVQPQRPSQPVVQSRNRISRGSFKRVDQPDEPLTSQPSRIIREQGVFGSVLCMYPPVEAVATVSTLLRDSLAVSRTGAFNEHYTLGKLDAARHCPVKIAYFGSSKILTKRNECRTLCGTPGYVAPEVLELYPAYDVEVDVWSFGVVMFLLLGGYLPFDSRGEHDMKRIFEQTRNGEYNLLPEQWRDISPSGKDLVGLCLTVVPGRRISAENALHHPWFETSIEKLSILQISSIDVTSMRDTNDRIQKLQELKDVVSDFHMRSRIWKSESFADLSRDYRKTGVSTSSSASLDDSATGQPFSYFYAIGKFLGEGKYGTVHRCKHKRTGLLYAVKALDHSTFKHEKVWDTLKEEMEVLKLLRGAPNIIYLFDVFRESNKTYIILEEMKGGNLLNRIKDRERYTEREARQLCRELFVAVEFCHNCCIVHRDIKLDNLLLQEKGNDLSLKLADFGFSKMLPTDRERQKLLRTICGTRRYMAPEVFRADKEAYDLRCDMWSVGVVVFILVGGVYPFDNKLIEEKKYPEKVYFDPKVWSASSTSVQKLIVGLLEQDVDKRLSAKMALESRWIRTEDDGKLSALDLSATQSRLSGMSVKEKVLSGIPGEIFVNTEVDFLQRTRKQETFPQESTNSAATDSTGFTLEFSDVYKLTEEKGIGLFSKFHPATGKSSGHEFSVKKIVRRELLPGEYKNVNNEIEILEDFKKQRGNEVVEGAFLVQLHEVYRDPDVTYLVFQKLQGEVLLERLNRQTKFPEYEARELIGSLLVGVSYCHSKRVAIRNLTLDNLLLPHGLLRIVITDFEYAKRVVFKNTLRTQCGTFEFVAPEVLQSNLAYDVDCDMWSVGVILYMMLSGSHPFHVDASTHIRGKALDTSMLRRIRYGDYRFPREHGWNQVSLNAKSLVQLMLTVNPEERVSASNALLHRWIVGDSNESPQ
eukprot:Nitzschia sp. Nitz4//NODE_611_length_9286_cov_71.495179//2100//8013//NITZ4_additional_000090-RA//1//CDS//3329532002//3658//frame0